MNFLKFYLGMFFALTFSAASLAAEMRLAVTTSFHNSGLSEIMLPAIKDAIDIDVHLLIVGTGQALKLGRAGDVDAILVHSRDAEDVYVAERYSTHRREIMYNDFVFIGPSGDPANISKAQTAVDVLKALQRQKAPFVSRGDSSGTHRKELSLWEKAEFNTGSFSPNWYRSAGAGMGASLNTASGMNAYIMADRASWLNFKNKGQLKLLFSGDPLLFNQYAYLPGNAEKHLHVKSKLAEQLENWLTSPKAQALIAAYTVNGQTLFTPNATPINRQ